MGLTPKMVLKNWLLQNLLKQWMCHHWMTTPIELFSMPPQSHPAELVESDKEEEVTFSRDSQSVLDAEISRNIAEATNQF